MLNLQDLDLSYEWCSSDYPLMRPSLIRKADIYGKALTIFIRALIYQALNSTMQTEE